MFHREQVIGLRAAVLCGFMVAGGGVRALGRVSAPPVTEIDKEVLAVRETAWRAWFAGDEKMLGDLLPEEFIAIDARGSEMSDRAKALGSSRAFKAAGGRLV